MKIERDGEDAATTTPAMWCADDQHAVGTLATYNGERARCSTVHVKRRPRSAQKLAPSYERGKPPARASWIRPQPSVEEERNKHARITFVRRWRAASPWKE